MKNKSLVVVMGVLLIVVIGGVWVWQKNNTQAIYHNNPAPVSGYAISVSQVDPGNRVEIESLDTTQSVYLAVIKDGKNLTEIGKSEMLTVGHHGKMVIELKSMLTDGDVIFVRLVDSNGKVVTNSNLTNVEVKKNVGMAMSHYQNEY